MPKLLSKSRYLIILAVFGSLLCATTLLFYGAWHAIELAIQGELGGKKLEIVAIELVDYFLLATVFYIVARDFMNCLSTTLCPFRRGWRFTISTTSSRDFWAW